MFARFTCALSVSALSVCALIVCVGASCFGPAIGSVECGAGNLCPPGFVCDTSTDQCVAPGTAQDAGADPEGDARSADDTDGDGVPNSSDNCPSTSNAEQYDEDADTFGDECDNCPGRFNDQADTDGDRIGDNCDPRPTTDGDVILLFDGFNGDTLSSWTTRGGAWSVAGGQAIQGSPDLGLAALVWDSDPIASPAIFTLGQSTELPPEGDGDDDIRSIGVLGHYDAAANNDGRGYSCSHFYDPSDPDGAGDTQITLVDIGLGLNLLSANDAPNLTVNGPVRFYLDLDATPRQICETETAGMSSRTTANGVRHTQGSVGIFTYSNAGSFDYAFIVGRE